MSLRSTTSLLLLALGIFLTPTVGAQKGGKPKPVDKTATATFRCNGPTAQTRIPAGTLCGPTVESLGIPDGITGDGASYVGVGDTVSGTGGFLRSDGELEVILRAPGTRQIFLNFEE